MYLPMHFAISSQFLNFLEGRLPLKPLSSHKKQNPIDRYNLYLCISRFKLLHQNKFAQLTVSSRGLRCQKIGKFCVNNIAQYFQKIYYEIWVFLVPIWRVSGEFDINYIFCSEMG